MFAQWLGSKNPMPYNSYGNGSAMRIGPVGMHATTLEYALELSDKLTSVTHNHPEGIKAARAVTSAVYLFKHMATAEEVRNHIEVKYLYNLGQSVDEIRPTYERTECSQGSVPQAIICALDATSYEDAVRNSISLGGDSDTIAAIAGGIAEARFGVPEAISQKAKSFLPEDFRSKLDIFYQHSGLH